VGIVDNAPSFVYSPPRGQVMYCGTARPICAAGPFRGMTTRVGGQPVPTPYSAQLLDHLDSPRNEGKMPSPDAVGIASLSGRAPYFTIYLKVANGIIEKATFQAFGCGYSIAACSAMTEMVTGKAVGACLRMTADEVLQALGGMPEHKRYCAELAIAALRDAIAKLAHPSVAPEER